MDHSLLAPRQSTTDNEDTEMMNTGETKIVETGNTTMQDADHLPTQTPDHVRTVRAFRSELRTKWKGAMPKDWLISPQSQWGNIFTPTDEVVAPYPPDPRWAANGVEISPEADAAAGDPLLTAHTKETWAGTVLVFISRIMGDTKWKLYKPLVRYLILNNYNPEDEGDWTQSRGVMNAAGVVLQFLTQNPRIAHLHNELARGIGNLPIAPNLRRCDREMKTLMRRIGDDFGRELRIEHGQAFTVIPEREGKDDEEDRMGDDNFEALECLVYWDERPPAGEGLEALLAVFGNMTM